MYNPCICIFYKCIAGIDSIIHSQGIAKDCMFFSSKKYTKEMKKKGYNTESDFFLPLKKYNFLLPSTFQLSILTTMLNLISLFFHIYFKLNSQLMTHLLNLFKSKAVSEKTSILVKITIPWPILPTGIINLNNSPKLQNNWMWKYKNTASPIVTFSRDSTMQPTLQ